MLNSTVLERAYASAYLGPQDSQEAFELRKRIADGSRRSLESQSVKFDVIHLQSDKLTKGIGR